MTIRTAFASFLQALGGVGASADVAPDLASLVASQEQVGWSVADDGSLLSDMDASMIWVGSSDLVSQLSDIDSISSSLAPSYVNLSSLDWLHRIDHHQPRLRSQPNLSALARIVATVHGVTAEQVALTIDRDQSANTFAVRVVLPWGAGTSSVTDLALRADDADAVWAESALAAAQRCAETEAHADAPGRAIALEGIEK